MVKRVAYAAELKLKTVEMKLAGISIKQILKELNIKNETQIYVWEKWYKNGEWHRFNQQVGQQYSYNHTSRELTEIEQLKLENKRQAAEIDILKKYKELERKCRRK